MEESSLEKRQLGFSHVRLLPKETGVRPIVNLRRKVSEQCNAVWAANKPME